MTTKSPRRPRVFDTNEAGLVIETSEPAPAVDVAPGPAESAAGVVAPSLTDFAHGIRWGAILLSACLGLVTLSASLAFASFISAALSRDDWIGWTAFVLAAAAGMASLVLVLRELAGMARLSRLGRLKKDVAEALRTRDLSAERTAVAGLKSLYAGRHQSAWGLARLAEHESNVRDPGALLRLAERELLSPLDLEARRTILKSAKRVSIVTAMSPMVLIAMVYVVIENLRMMRGLATLYGGKPGLAGAMRLFSRVVSHIVATGGLALTDDLLGQFLGQDLLRRLSRRLGEGLFNGALTARLGVAAIEVTRPLPFLDAEPVRARDLIPEIFRKLRGAEQRGPGAGPSGGSA